MFLNIVVFICRSMHMALIIWQSYAILPCEMLQRVNTLIKYLWEYSNFKCSHLAIWAMSKDRKWILKEKLSGKFPLDIGFCILWEQVLCLINLWIFRAESVPGTEQTFKKCLWNEISIPEVSTRDLLASIKQYMKNNNCFI